jgi:hypothetical protein
MYGTAILVDSPQSFLQLGAVTHSRPTNACFTKPNIPFPINNQSRLTFQILESRPSPWLLLFESKTADMKGDMKSAFANVCARFKIEKLNDFQQNAIIQVVEKNDVFVNVPTGFGKSLIYQTLPMIFDHLTVVSKQRSRL